MTNVGTFLAVAFYIYIMKLQIANKGATALLPISPLGSIKFNKKSSAKQVQKKMPETLAVSSIFEKWSE